MANQMIALQARAPQMLGLGSAISQNAQLINMMMQQRVAQRQAEQAQQKMAIDAQLAGPQLEKATSDAQSARVKVFKDFMQTATYGMANARNANDAFKIGEILKSEFTDPIFTNIVDQTLSSIPQDPAEFSAWKDNNLAQSMDALQQLEMKYPKPTASVTYGLGGQMNQTVVGGMPGTSGVFPLQQFKLDTTQNPPRTGQFEVEQPTIMDGGLDGGVASVLANVKSDREYQDVLKAIEMQNPNAAAAIRQAMPTFDPSRMEGIRAEAARAFGGVGGPDIPLVAGPRGGPYVPTGQQAVGKDPIQSPTPGIYNVPTGQVSSTSKAEKAGAEEATRIADLKKALPKAKGALGLATKQLARDIADVDYVLSNPYREMVVGQIEGRLPSAVNIFRSGGQDAQNVQDRLDKINASSVVKHLQQMRDASPQGSSLFGQVTEYEDRLVAALAGLKQTQDEATFERSLREYRNVLVEMYQNLPQVFNDTYGEIGAKEGVPMIAKAPRKSPTISDVEYLRRNRNNPNVVNGFRQHFGDSAYRMAIGAR